VGGVTRSGALGKDEFASMRRRWPVGCAEGAERADLPSSNRTSVVFYSRFHPICRSYWRGWCQQAGELEVGANRKGAVSGRLELRQRRRLA